MRHTIWVVVADEAIARILEWPETGDELVPVQELTDPDAHAKGADLRRDAVGRRAGSGPGGTLGTAGHATESAGEDLRHREAEGFAKQVAQHLHAALNEGRFDELRLVAAPRFLGMLRKALSPQVSRVVSDELNKDLVHMVNADITTRVFPSGNAGSQARL